LLAHILFIGILLVSSDNKIMRKQMPSKLSFILMVLVTLLMFGAGIGMFVFWFSAQAPSGLQNHARCNVGCELHLLIQDNSWEISGLSVGITLAEWLPTN
jgi:hypothetical protein